tara:strand:+ start:30 stop:305 length:276 start_codon:yes stop_codon:yes gene_type:complete
MDNLNDDEINEFLSTFEAQIGDCKLDINEVKNYMKLVDLPFECNINKDNKEETFNNLYCWYKYRGDDDMISRMPEPYYSMYLNNIVDELCN